MNYIIKVGSVTNAQRGAKLLRSYGYKPNVTRLENPSKSDGCGFVIKVYDSQDRVTDILSKNGIRILGADTL